MKKLWILSMRAIFVLVTCVPVVSAMDPIMEEEGSGEQIIRTYTTIHALVKNISRLSTDLFESDLVQCLVAGLEINAVEHSTHFDCRLTPLDYVDLQLGILAKQVVINKQFILPQEQHKKAHEILKRYGAK